MALLDSRIDPRQVAELVLVPEQGADWKESELRVLGSLAAFSDDLDDPLTETAADRSREVFRLSRDPKTFEVTVESDITLDDYKKITTSEHFNFMLGLAEPLRGKTAVFINPTMEGGGVAMMRPALINLLRQLGVDAHWFVMEGGEDGKPNPFIATKKMHNIIQRRLAPDVRLTEEDKAIHQYWATGRNKDVLVQQPAIQTADFVIIDDPQPTPLISHLKAVNPNAKFTWRDHIDNDGQLMNDPTTPQGEVWQYLRDECGIGLADAFVFHPSPGNKFVPPDVFDKTHLMPATTEPHDDMNKELTTDEIAEGIAFINDGIAAKNEDLDDEDKMELINPSRPAVAMVARFDESKGGDKCMALGVRTKQKVREKLGALGLPADSKEPQIIFIGNGSKDDPSGPPEFERMLGLRRERYPSYKQDIILARIKHNYGAINAFMHKREAGAAVVGVQMSDAEGCETRISDWIEHGVPVVVSNRGGMSFQVSEKSGLVLDFDKPDFDIERGAEFISDLIINPELYESLADTTAAAGETYNRREYTTTANVTRWLRLFNGLPAGQKPDKRWKISELIES